MGGASEGRAFLCDVSFVGPRLGVAVGIYCPLLGANFSGDSPTYHPVSQTSLLLVSNEGINELWGSPKFTLDLDGQ